MQHVVRVSTTSFVRSTHPHERGNCTRNHTRTRRRLQGRKGQVERGALCQAFRRRIVADPQRRSAFACDPASSVNASAGAQHTFGPCLLPPLVRYGRTARRASMGPKRLDHASTSRTGPVWAWSASPKIEQTSDAEHTSCCRSSRTGRGLGVVRGESFQAWSPGTRTGRSDAALRELGGKHHVVRPGNTHGRSGKAAGVPEQAAVRAPAGIESMEHLKNGSRRNRDDGAQDPPRSRRPCATSVARRRRTSRRSTCSPFACSELEWY